MNALVGTAPSHRALELLGRFVRYFDSNPIARQYVRAGGDAELLSVEREARALIAAPSMPEPHLSSKTPRPWCARCHAFHEMIEDRRKPAVRS